MTPIPSLKRDSPLNFTKRDLDNDDLSKMDRTAMGSVGEINAPKSKAYTNGSSTPMRGAIKYNTVPTTPAVINTPIVANNKTDHLEQSNSFKLTWMAPAKSKKPNNPSRRRLLKSIPSIV
jgi:hypothetical protein